MHRSKPPASVTYSKPMPDSEILMDVWHPDIEAILQNLELPGPDLDINLDGYIKIVCAILGIPIHNLLNNKSHIESLHVLFSLYSYFKVNQHFKKDFEDYQQPMAYE